jgi:glucans biosynthesis protein C
MPQINSLQQDKKRLYFADALRLLVILSLVPFHAALTYTGNGDVYSYDPNVVAHYFNRSVPAGIVSVPMDLFVDILDNFFMRLLFLVSGFVVWYSLERRTPGRFRTERVKKLFLPLVAGIIFVIPILSYFRNCSLYGYKGSFLDFYPLFFNGPRGAVPGGNFEWGHLWFLIYLFVYSLITLPVFTTIRKEHFAASLRKLNANIYLLLPVVPLLIFEWAFRPGWPGTLNLYSDWANFVNYLLFYVSGYLLAAAPDLLERIKKLALPALAIGLIFFTLKIILWRTLSFQYGYNVPTLIVISCKALAGYFLVIGTIGLAARYLEMQSKRWKYLYEASFGIYIFHFLPVTILGFYLINLDINYYLKFVITVVLSFPVIFLLYETVRRIPGLRFLFSLKKPAPRLQEPATQPQP